MNWRKAHRNRRRQLRARMVSIEPAYFMRNPDIGWEEWLKQMLPTMLNPDSVMARILMRKPVPTPSHKIPMCIPKFVPKPMPHGFYPSSVEMSEGQRRAIRRIDRTIQKMIYEDLDYPSSRYFKVAPDPPKPIKEFIYGENWTAYRRVNAS